jgi:hypothetical protein
MERFLRKLEELPIEDIIKLIKKNKDNTYEIDDKLKKFLNKLKKRLDEKDVQGEIINNGE